MCVCVVVYRAVLLLFLLLLLLLLLVPLLKMMTIMTKTELERFQLMCARKRAAGTARARL